ncbi:MAG: hypothetical protein ACK5D5_13165 [Bacteroidota bacterium]|jgi:hypothetical protein
MNKTFKSSILSEAKILILLLVLSCFYACGPLATFDEPQPAGEKNLSAIPERIQGKYLSTKDSSILYVQDKLIKRIYDFNYKLHKNEIDSTFKISGDTIINVLTGEKNKVKQDRDTLFIKVSGVDTVFKLNYDNVIRKYMGYYFLNIRRDESAWEVKKINISKGKLKLSWIANAEQIKSLVNNNETNQDTIVPKNFTVTRKQFKDIIKGGGFGEEEIFIKVR